MNTVDRILAAIQALIVNFNTSTSRLFGRIAEVIGTIIDEMQLEISRTITRIDESARTQRVAGRQYYIDKSLAFQNGDPLVIINPETLEEGYAVTDESKQIVKQVSIGSNRNAEIYLRVAKANDNNTALVQLSTDELANFRDYMYHFNPVGITIDAVSLEADEICAQTLFIRYLPQYALSSIKESVITVLQGYQFILRGETPLYVNDIEMALQEIPGVSNAYFVNIEVTSQVTGSVMYPVNGVLDLPAGYFNFCEDLKALDPNIVIFQSNDEI